MSKIKLEVGKTFITRDGKTVVKIIKQWHEDHIFCYEGDNREYYTRDGEISRDYPNPKDLDEEVITHEITKLEVGKTYIDYVGENRVTIIGIEYNDFVGKNLYRGSNNWLYYEDGRDFILDILYYDLAKEVEEEG